MNHRDLRFTPAAYYKSAGAISFIRNKTGASGATQRVTDALSSLFGKAELFSILRHFALFINHPRLARACLSLFDLFATHPYIFLSPFLPFSPFFSFSLGIQAENKCIRYSVIKRRRNTVRPPRRVRVGETVRVGEPGRRRGRL